MKNTELILSVSDPDSDPELPPPEHPDPGTPQPGKPPGTPRPGDPPPAEPKPDKPAPIRPKSVTTLLIALIILLSTSNAAFTQPLAESIDDDDILEAVEADLRSDVAVSADNVDVTVNAGVVTLSGKAFTLLAKRRAVRLIGSLKGVRSIVDQVEVVPNGQSDGQIFADVQAALEDDPVADVDKIQVTVGQGRVKLEGAVDSFAEKSLLEATVAGVRGVVEINNQLSILAPTIRSDKEIKPEILRRFELNPYLAEGLIDVVVRRGKVTLGGAVGSLNEKVIASVLCWVPGVRQVDDTNLEIKWWLDRDRRRDKFTVLRNDVQLQRAVQDALLYDPRIQGAEITVRVRRGAVSLSGDVSSLAAKRAAEHDAENTLGVRRVINQLKVKNPDWPGDVAVTERGREALARDSHLTDFDLKASSHFGKVYLRGDVNTHFEKERAAVVIANLPGVLDVVNRIHVDADEVSKPDEQIEEDTKRRLRWSPLLDAEQINVAVDDGTVTLRGTVDTWHQRKAAERHAYQAGAQRVANNIAVRLERGAPLGLRATLVPQTVNYELDPKHSASLSDGS